MYVLTQVGCALSLSLIFMACDSGNPTAPVQQGGLSGKYVFSGYVERYEYDFTSADHAILSYTHGQSHESVEIEYRIDGDLFKSTALILGSKEPFADNIIELSTDSFTLFEPKKSYKCEDGGSGLDRRWISTVDTMTIVGDTLMSVKIIDPLGKSGTEPIRIEGDKILSVSPGYPDMTIYHFKLSGDDLFLFAGQGQTYVKTP